MLEVLSRLPFKTLLQLRCVSKSWRALIDSPYFIKSHLNRYMVTNTNLNLIWCPKKIPTETNHDLLGLNSIEIDSLDHSVDLDNPIKSGESGESKIRLIQGSCNGLLYLTSKFSNSEELIALWNPSTRKHQMLMVASIELTRERSTYRAIVFGFGYDCVHDDYKVVRMVEFYGKDNDSFEIQDFPYYLWYPTEKGEFASGALHWVVRPKPESDKSRLIAAFDLGDKEYRLVPQLDYSVVNLHMNVVVLEGCLCLVCNYVSVHVDIWVMKEYGVKESWTKLFSVAQPTTIEKFDWVWPLAYSHSHKKVLMEQDNKRLLWYDLEKKTVEYIEIHEVEPWLKLIPLPAGHTSVEYGNE
ncbi:F-box protein CPR1-like [Cornus florida]|uniref:F-box protein CPR1-like n=1 Tax=Cornus florida TaxID=4283 RepID=UPI0028A0B439|nr:F-box protein CPR1-like [Cornus florida]